MEPSDDAYEPITREALLAEMRAGNDDIEEDDDEEYSEGYEPEITENYSYDYFYRVPYDYYEEIRDVLLDIIPDFRMRLKTNPATGNVVFAADIHSVFDISWYVLARALVDFGTPEDHAVTHGKENKANRSLNRQVICTCTICGKAFAREGNRRLICGDPECKRKYDADRQRQYRRNQKKKANISVKAERKNRE